MTLRNGTRRDLRLGLRQMLNEFAEVLDIGRENRALARFREDAQKNLL
jgi:hypothetical protein